MGKHVRKAWTVDVSVDEHGAETTGYRTVVLARPRGLWVLAWRSSIRRTAYFAAIGDELAVARALFDAAKQIMAVTEDDIENVTDEPVTFQRWKGAGVLVGAPQ